MQAEYISNLYQLQQHLYYILAQDVGGNNNFYHEKMDINFIRKQLENNVDNPKGIEHII
jgi:hypothetical protein